MRTRDDIECWLTDMDGVLVHENVPIPGACRAARAVARRGHPVPRADQQLDLHAARPQRPAARARVWIVPEDRIWTSALATADFLQSQLPGGSAFVIGEAGLTTALHEAGFIMTETDPDYVVVGETRNYSFEAITKAIRLINDGARFIVTNPDATGPSPTASLPATGAIAALITKATGKEPYVVGKPNPMMFRSALNRIGAHSENTGMIGDRMDTDVVAGIEAGLHTILVLTGISDQAEIERYPFRPDEIVDSVADLRARTDHRTIRDCPTRHLMGALDDGERVVAAGCRDLARVARGRTTRHPPGSGCVRARTGRTRPDVVYEDASGRRSASDGSTGPCAPSTRRRTGCGSRRAARGSGWAATNKARIASLETRGTAGRGRHPRARGRQGERRRGRCSTDRRPASSRPSSPRRSTPSPPHGRTGTPSRRRRQDRPHARSPWPGGRRPARRGSRRSSRMPQHGRRPST